LLALARVVANAGCVPALEDARRASGEAARRTKAAASSARKPRANRLGAFRAAMRATFAAAAGAAADGDGDDLGTRYAPPAKALLAALCDDALDADAYPSLNGPRTPAKPAKAAAQSVRKNASRLAKGKKTAAAYVGPKLIVVVLGGATYSELRAAYEVSKDKSREIVIAGSTLLTPDAFLASLA